MNVIGSLTRIKKFREDKAEREVTRARGVVQEAELGLGRAEEALAEYRAAILRRENALYLDLFSRLVVRGDLDDVAAELAHMKQKTGDYEEEVESARTVLNSARDNLEHAKGLYRIAMKAREKFTELGLRFAEEEAALRGMIEEGELEEVSGSTFGRRARGDGAGGGIGP